MKIDDLIIGSQFLPADIVLYHTENNKVQPITTLIYAANKQDFVLITQPNRRPLTLKQLIARVKDTDAQLLHPDLSPVFGFQVVDTQIILK